MEWVNFKVKEGEREKLKKDAHRHEMNISEYLRWLIEKQRKEDDNKIYFVVPAKSKVVECLEIETDHPTEKGSVE